jgi:glycosyltransferase involved in cell wall biosynthesis
MERLSQTDIYVLPSVQEPFPMSVLEAMSLGKPVIITSSCGLADAVRSHDAGLVVGESDEELEAAIEALLSDPCRRQTMGSNAAELVASRFSIRSVAASLMELYRRT